MISGLTLSLCRLGLSHGSLFLDLPRRWSNRSRFCTKAKKAAEEETPAEPVEGVAQGDDQSEAPRSPRRKRKPLRHRINSPRRPIRANWTIRGTTLNDDASRAGRGGYARLARRAVPNQRQRTLFCGSGYFLNG